MRPKITNILSFNQEEFIKKTTDKIVKIINGILENTKQDSINIALSGGKSPLPIYENLINYNIDWDKIRFFLVDERCVHVESDDCNFKNINQCFFSKIPSQAHPILIDKMDFKDLTLGYQELIRNQVHKNINQDPQFDLIILGMGLDGHTASLFPNTKALNNYNDLVVLNKVPQLNSSRITMTYRLIENAKNLVLIARGKEKKAVLLNSLNSNLPIMKLISKIDIIFN